MDRYKKANETHLPSGFRRITEKKSGEAGTVRRYAMTKKARKNWLSAYMKKSVVIDPDEIKSGRIVTAAEDEKEKARKILAVLIGAFSMVLLIAAVTGLLVLMKIETVEVRGETGYSAGQLLEASGLSYGKSLLVGRLKAGDPKEKLPLLESCDISIDLPGTVVFTVTETKPALYAEIHGSWFSLSRDLRVVAMEDSPEGFADAGLVLMTLPELSSATSGSRVEFAEEQTGSYISDVIGAVLDRKDAMKFDRVFLDVKYGIVINVGGSFRLYLGSSADAALKLDTAIRIIEEEKKAGTESAYIDLSDPSRAGVRKLVSIDPLSRES